MYEPVEKTPESHSSRDFWIRGLYMLLFLIIGYLVGFVVFFVVLLQFILTLITKTPNGPLQELGKSLSAYFYEIIYFLTYNTEEKPFPFKKWPLQPPV